MSTCEVIPYGEWPSPISATTAAVSGTRLAFPQLVGSDLWWTAGRPAEGGRQVVLRRAADGTVSDVLPVGWNARTRVHEYGGLSYAVADGVLVFSEFTDQRLYSLADGATDPQPLTPEPEQVAALRYADLLVVGDEVWCVREAHVGSGVRRHLVAVALDGSQTVRELAGGSNFGASNFLAHPRLSPDGTHLAWIAWDHPQMPWDGTELRVAAVSDGVLGAPRTLLGGPSESVMQPEWADDGHLYALTDSSGWWNLVRLDLSGGEPEPLHPVESELGAPLWQLGQTSYAVLDDGRLAVTHGVGRAQLAVLDPTTGSLEDVEVPFDSLTAVRAQGRKVSGIATSPTAATAIVVVELAAASAAVVSLDVLDDGSDGPEVAAQWMPVPTAEALPGVDGRTVHALVYPPTHPSVVGPPDELPPCVVFVHGGPTSQAVAARSMEKAYFTSRGFTVLDVNYGGSSGYGRVYRNALREQWGVLDVADCVAAAHALVHQGRVDGDRLVIRGGSAGGWTVLAALTGTDAFAAGASYYGVAELERFAADTHDFESRYLDSLIGPLPQAQDRYVSRAPLNHVDELSCPVLLLQGDEDQVVPPSQSELFRDAMVRNGIPHAYLLFAGEQHGFRKAENVATALEAEVSFYGQVLGFTPPEVAVLTLVRP
ncbi:MAG: prolyl oligopeptidase family serine peptidase [Mycobacteriaceae bacterium]